MNASLVRGRHDVRLIFPYRGFWSLSHNLLTTSAQNLVIVRIRQLYPYVFDIKISAELLQVHIIDSADSDITIVLDRASHIRGDSVPLFDFDALVLLFGILLNSLHVVGMLFYRFNSLGPQITLILVNVCVVPEIPIIL